MTARAERNRRLVLHFDINKVRVVFIVLFLYYRVKAICLLADNNNEGSGQECRDRWYAKLFAQ